MSVYGMEIEALADRFLSPINSGPEIEQITRDEELTA